MRFRFRFILLMFMCIYNVATSQILKDSVQIHFRQSKTDVDTSYMHNGDSLRRFIKYGLNNYQPDSLYSLRSVTVVGGASPEGSVRFNEWLSSMRAQRLCDYLVREIMIPDSLTAYTRLGRDWPGLRRMVVADPDVPDRDGVVAVIDDILVNYQRGERESDDDLNRLRRLDGGIPYRYLYRNMFPALRESKVVLTFAVRMPSLPCEVPVEVFAPISLTATEICVPTPLPTRQRNFYMALKTNMLSDVLALPQVAAEFYIGQDFSIVGNWMYGWWDNNSAHRYWRAYGGDVTVRWWFGHQAQQKPLTGHHVGLYGGVLTYDFEFGGKGWMGGRPGHSLWDRCMHMAGVEYGYSLPVARRLNIDFALGLGYMGGKYVEYVPNGSCYEWQATKQKHWFGPTKAEVSLTWLIGCGNYNYKYNRKGVAE